jgi:glutamine amidotransferase
MARLFGLIGNRADLAGRVLELERETLMVPEGLLPAGAISWGIGFYQGGEVLLRRRPSDERTTLDLARLAKDVRSDLIIGHARVATFGSTRTENTHPFRYREWHFAHTGTIERYEQIKPRLLESIPEFLGKNIRGDTDSEVLFHLVLSFLFDAGRLQDGGRADARTVSGALASTASLVDQLVAEEGGKPGFTMNALLTNGEMLGALHRSGSDDHLAPSRMSMRIVHGRHDMDLLVADDALRRVRLTDPGALRFTLLASDFAEQQKNNGPSSEPPPGAWTPLPPRAIVVTTRDAAPQVETF